NTHADRSDIGNLWENWVVAEFSKSTFLGGNIRSMFFWQSRSGSEVDLVIKEPAGDIKAYEIKWSGGKVSKSFSSRYKIPVQLIHKNNFIDHLF
ncbi:MAG TPA: DUF4143 domain-containing protein, partial [Candidatus Dojkabacteria bacterium]